MATTEQIKNQVAKVEITPLQTMIESSAKELGRVLPKGMRPERLVRIALTCIRANPKLARCTPESFVGALLTTAQIGIEPILGRGYILPFSNSKKIDGKWFKIDEAVFLLGYRGIADLFYRHEKSCQLAWGVVKEGDDFEYAYGTDAYLTHRPNMKQRGSAIGYYVIATLQGGSKPFLYMSHEDCIEHGKKHSKTYVSKVYDEKQQKMIPCDPHFLDDSPWLKDTESMCLKTVLIQLSKTLPLSIEAQQAIAADESSREYRAGIKDAFEMPNTSWEKPQEAEIVKTEQAQQPSAPTTPAKPLETAPVDTNEAPADNSAQEPKNGNSAPETDVLTITGKFKRLSYRTITSKKDGKTYDITDWVVEKDGNLVTVSQFGKHDPKPEGTEIVCSDITQKEYKGVIQYMAQRVEDKIVWEE